MPRLRKPTEGHGNRKPVPAPKGAQPSVDGAFDEDMLRWAAEAAEQALRTRIRLQREVRALGGSQSADAEVVQQQLQMHTFEGRRLSHAVACLTRQHPAWNWLESFKSINPMVVGKLLARLDIHGAHSPECFWRQCDLSVVRAIECACDRCGRTVTMQPWRTFTRQHRDPGTGEECPGILRPSKGARRRVLIAAPRADKDSATDPLAKRYLYLTVNALVRAEQRYANFHRHEREKIHRDRPQWHSNRKHFGALRKVKKRFLLELWVAWRNGLGLSSAHSVPDPHLELDSRAD